MPQIKMPTDQEVLRNIAANLRRLAEEKEVSLGDLEKLTGDRKSTISNTFRKIHMPGSGLLTRLAMALDTTTDDLTSAR